MDFSIYITTLCLLCTALVFQDAIAINLKNYASSSDCAVSSAPLSGTISLNPTGPNNVTLSANVHLDEELDSPLQAVVDFQAKVAWWWVTVPCAGNFGSCTHRDVCRFLPPSTNGTSGSTTCPAPFRDLPSCQCPLRAGTYSAQVEIVIPSVQLPALYFLTSGKYWAQVKLYQGHREVGCNEIYFNV